MSNFERVIRWILGTALLAWAMAGGPLWAYLGIVILATGSFGFAPVKFLSEINTKDD